MSRLFSYMANDPDRVRCALHGARQLLVASATDKPFDGWGIGFYQGGEVLLQRRPRPPSGEVDFYRLTSDLRTDCIIGHARAGTVGKPKNENTHPFRFRSWLFAHHGTIPEFERIREPLLAAVPDFLQRNIRGQTDSEHLFHLLLAFLHDAGHLDDVEVSTQLIAEAVRESMALVDQLLRKAKVEPGNRACALAVTSGRVMVAARRGTPMQLLRVDGIADCPVCRGEPAATGRAAKPVAHEHLRSVLIVADAPPPTAALWQEVADNAIVAVTHDLTHQLLPL